MVGQLHIYVTFLTLTKQAVWTSRVEHCSRGKSWAETDHQTPGARLVPDVK